MKKNIFVFGIAIICAIALGGCQKEIVESKVAANETVREYIPFEIQLAIGDTKVATDASLKNTWEEGDAICIWHAEAGTNKFIKDGKFTAKESGNLGIFNGALAQGLEKGINYDWYAVYPYRDDLTDPKTIHYVFNDNFRIQPSNGGTENVRVLPLYSSYKDVPAGNLVVLTMHQIFSLAKVTITNVNFASQIDVNNFGFSFSEGLMGDEAYARALYGDFTADITGTTASLNTESGYLPQNAMVNFAGKGYTIKKGESRTHYVPVFPGITLPKGTFLNFHTLGNGENAKQVRLDQDLTFKAGEVTTFNVNLDKENYFITEDEMVKPVMFRTVYRGEKWLGKWNTQNRPRYFSTIDHKKGLSNVMTPTGAVWDYGRAYIGVEPNTGENTPGCGDNGGRYYLIGCSLKNTESSYTITANYEKLPAGKTVAFFSSFLINKPTPADDASKTEINFSLSYSINGSDFKPARVKVFGGDKSENGDVSFCDVNDVIYMCHPFIVETDPTTGDIEKATVVFKMTPKNTPELAVGFAAFAPYYEYDPTQGYKGFRSYCKLAVCPYPEGYTKAAAWDYVKTANVDPTVAKPDAKDLGDYEDVTGSCYLIVTDGIINAEGGIDDWKQGGSFNFVTK